MKRFALFLLIIVSLPLFAADHDVSVWTKFSRNGDTKLIPWYVTTSENGWSADLRYDFDWAECATGLIGKKFESGKVSVTPYIGYIAGEYHGPTGQVNFFYAGDKVQVFSLNQIARGGNGHPDFGYHYFQLRMPVSERVSVGFDEEVYAENGSDTTFGGGPAVNIKLGKISVTVTPYFEVGEEYTKTMVGLGTSF